MLVSTIVLSNLFSNLYQSTINSHKIQNASNNYKYHLHEVSGETLPKIKQFQVKYMTLTTLIPN